VKELKKLTKIYPLAFYRELSPHTSVVNKEDLFISTIKYPGDIPSAFLNAL
jgi:hypothetical protein